MTSNKRSFLVGEDWKYSSEIPVSKVSQLSLWEQESGNQYVMNNFNSNGYLSLKQYLKKVEDKRLVSFEVANGRAIIVFEAV